ncbi:hypothetical protein LS70_003910 [Helicobacter sp. MIT 11-5569]|uniref:hypothetical protein n=1 Tax=Helicobacter sp. MIT 11-5569 TaxID=1548151 RepID=UPI00051F91BE|nr:hypothetical protein [Helicobacter sp. MIT 11-5569]TLD83962.1 hypothetical protein LS70_003910 [Helicobacter sp. MIT 11-5569]
MNKLEVARKKAIENALSLKRVEHTGVTAHLMLENAKIETKLKGNTLSLEFLAQRQKDIKQEILQARAKCEALVYSSKRIVKEKGRLNAQSLKYRYLASALEIDYLFENVLLANAKANAQFYKVLALVANAQRKNLPELQAQREKTTQEIKALNVEVCVLYEGIIEVGQQVAFNEEEIKRLEIEIERARATLALKEELLKELKEHALALKTTLDSTNQSLRDILDAQTLERYVINAYLREIVRLREEIKKAQIRKVELNDLLYQAIGKIKLLEGRLEWTRCEEVRTKEQIKLTRSENERN